MSEQADLFSRLTAAQFNKTIKPQLSPLRLPTRTLFMPENAARITGPSELSWLISGHPARCSANTDQQGSGW